jgi:hypothetical protein
MSLGSDFETLGEDTLDKYFYAVQRAIDRYDTGEI